MSRIDIPGTDQIIELIKGYRQPVAVTAVKPVDVSFIKDPGMRAVVTLATSCEWNMAYKPSRPVTLIARNGFKCQIPTDTSIKFGVFQNRVYATVTHSITHIPTPELAEQVIKLHKLDPSHARVIRDAVDKMAQAPVPEPEAATTPVVAEEFVPTERVEPTLNTAAKGQKYVSQIMETVIRRLVPEGIDQITYRCLVCGLEFPTKRGVGGHYGGHVIKGEAEAKPEARDNIIKVVPTETKQIYGQVNYDPDVAALSGTPPQLDDEPEPEPEPEPTSVSSMVEELLRSTVATISMLISEDRIKELERERDAANARANRLASDLRSLRELIGGLSDE